MFFRQHAAAFAEGARTHLHARLIAKSLLLAITAVNYAHADSNLLPNGDFSNTNELEGWTTVGPGSFRFVPNFDADNSAGSGSMELTYVDRSNPQYAVSSCFSVKPLATFSFGGKFVPQNIFGSISSAELKCNSYNDNHCASGETDLGLTAYWDANTNANPNFGTLVTASGSLDETAHSAQCTAIAYMSLSGTFEEPNPVQIDDLFFASEGESSSSPLLGGSLSGSWYDPTQSGQGFMLEFTAQANELIAAWFTFVPDGSGRQAWVYAQGKYDPTQSVVTIPAVVSSGTNFPPAFHSKDIKKAPWGELRFSFTDCNHATVAWSSTLPGYGAGSQQLTRLTSIDGSSCPK